MSETKVKIVILAGGQGARFWPISRKTSPKQFLSISTSGESLIQATHSRTFELSTMGNPLVVTNVLHQKLVKEHLPNAEIITEPVARNTAPAIGLAALFVRKQDPDAVMISLPADHAVSDNRKLRDTLEIAVKHASDSDDLVTIGIKPSFPNTAYGYIKKGTELSSDCFKVSRFFEKPNQERAQNYFDSGNYYWNSGMFIWKASAYLDAVEKFMPDLYQALNRIDGALGTPQQDQLIQSEFEKLESVSVDFGILEHANNCVVVQASDFGWNDVGSWDAWAEHFSKDSNNNLLHGDVLAIDSKNCTIHSDHKITAIVGAKDLVVIDSGDALLVCPRSRVQDVKKIVEELRRIGRDDLT
ncbi:MAG: mannose-1-phosphate guanylyltransferase [Bdellovibrionales bacterium]|nr:mannose-1-phosphate guanylyltransferase [Bdellovibrionales bacterium]